MVIREENEGLFNFLSPAVLTTTGLLLLGLGAYTLIALDFVFPVLPADRTVATIIANLTGQIVVTVVVAIVLIPLLGVKSVEHRPLTIKRTLKTVPAFCLTYAVSLSLAMVFWMLFTPLGIPVTPSYGAIELKAEHLANPLNLVVFFTTITFGAAVSEELLFRRTLIPSLEARGMAPLAAVIASSLGFSLTHMPNDIINGSLGYVVAHFATTLTIGIVLGISYVATRNVIFPMTLHGAINLVSFGGTILETIGDPGPLFAYVLAVLIIWIVGFVVAAITLWQVLKAPPASWTAVLRIKSKIDVRPGLFGYLAVAVVIVSIQVLGEIGLAFLLFPNLPLILAAICVFYLLFLVVLLWLLSQIRYGGISALKPGILGA